MIDIKVSKFIMADICLIAKKEKTTPKKIILSFLNKHLTINQNGVRH